MKPTQEKIFKTAIDLFSQSGYNGVSIRQIAKAVGIKKSSIYNHFLNKDNILETIYDYYKQEMKKTALSKEELDKKIGTIPFEQFWTIGLSNFHKKTEDPLMEKINNIILLEMFRDERARDIALCELFQRQQNLVCKIFKKMQEEGIIKKDFDPKVLAQEYTYPLLGLRFEYNILKSWNLDTKEVQKKMFDHIKFFSANVKSVTRCEADE
jgi:AcrR family transcriptional regulator